VTAAPHRRPTAFTIIELLVVVAIIGILLGILIPAIMGSRDRAAKLAETSDLRQVAQAWLMYSGQNKDRILPGHLNNDVQADWDVAYMYPDYSLIEPAPEYPDNQPNIAGPWPWRLLSYLDHDIAPLRNHLKGQPGDDRAMMAIAMEVAEQPGIAYNGWYLGGVWKMYRLSHHEKRPTARFHRVTVEGEKLESMAVYNLAQLRRQDELIAFLGAQKAEPDRVYRDEPDDAPGWYLGVPRTLARDNQWDWSPETHAITSYTNAAIPLGRYTGTVAVAHPDGSTSVLTMSEVEDQRRWIPHARDVGAVPARDFQHDDYDPP
jgi:prepilin-type N-terminal cleavage/methylation domain-containing protein